MAGLIDTSLIRPELSNAFAAGYRGAEQARQQSAQAAQQLARGRQQMQMDEMKMRQFQEDRAALTGLQAKLRAAGQSDDPKVFFRALTESNDPNIIMKGIEGLQRFQALEAYEREFGPGATAPGAITKPAAPEGELAAAPITPPMGTMREIAPGGAAGAEMPLTRGANALAPTAAAPANAMIAAQPAAPAQDVNALARRYSLAAKAGSPDAPVILKQIEATLRGDQTRPIAVSPGQIVIDPRTGQQVFAAPGKTTLSDRFVPVGRLVFDRETQQYISPTQAQLAQSQERAATTAAGPGGKPPVGYRFTPSGDLEPIPGGPASPSLNPKDIQKREAVFPQATQAVSGFETKSEQFIKELERLRDDPGLNQITGPIFGRTPSVSREGSRAQALYDKIFAKGGFQALQDMREASKTGGALGNVSNEEGRRLEKSIVGGLDRTQNIADVQQGINDLIDEIRTSKSRVRDAYDTTYEYRAQRGASGSAPAAKQMSPQDKQALDWANSNPKDPRAAQIKARLGVQ